MYDVQYENGEYENKGIRTDFEKEAQRLFGNGEILFTIYFRGSAISAGVLVFLYTAVKRTSSIHVVSTCAL